MLKRGSFFIKEKYKSVSTQPTVYRSALVLLVKKKTNIEPKFSNKKHDIFNFGYVLYLFIILSLPHQRKKKY
jgi:hypothetical protein